MSTDLDPATIGAEIEHLIQRLGALGESQAKSEAQELVRLLLSLYGAGLSRMLSVIRTEGGGPQAVLERFAEDGLIASLLVLHDLHPHPLERRVEHAIRSLQSHLPPHVTLNLVAVTHDTVRVRATFPSAGGGSLPGSFRAAIERAIQEAAPEITAIEVEGMDGGPTGALIQIVRRSETGPKPS